MLVAAVVDRDRGALQELYVRHEPWLSTRLAYRCSDRSLVEEAVQDTFVAVWGSAEDELLVGVELGDVGLALGRLSPELRMVVQATVLDGLSCQEAGRLLGIPSGTVKTRMMRARPRP